MMEDPENLAQKECERDQEKYCLPDFFRLEFPNLTRFLNENLLREYSRDGDVTDPESERIEEPNKNS
jgi:hypothetical protein